MIRYLQDAETYVALRREALLDTPLAFASSPEDDFASSAEAVREHLRRSPDAVILGAFQPHLVGTAGLYRHREIKAAHKAHIWGVYVTPKHRRQGIAAELLAAAVRRADAARTVLGHLSIPAMSKRN